MGFIYFIGYYKLSKYAYIVHSISQVHTNSELMINWNKVYIYFLCNKSNIYKLIAIFGVIVKEMLKRIGEFIVLI